MEQILNNNISIAENSLTENMSPQELVPVGRRIFNNRELFEMFPEAKSTIKRLIREDKEILAENELRLSQIKSNLSQKVSVLDIEKTAPLIFAVCRTDFIEHNSPRNKSGFRIGEWVSERLVRNEKLAKLFTISSKRNKCEDFEQKLSRARLFPIENLVKLDHYGRSLCPLHSEKTPSFFVNRKKNVWYCHGACGEGGDVISLYQKINNCDFVNAVNALS